MITLLLSALLLPSAARADGPYQLFQQEAQVVTTAERRSQPADEAPAAVDVITAEQIRASGALDLCDALRFSTALDVIDGRNIGGTGRCVVSIRGMARDQVRELMVLINGQSVYSPLSGTNLWEQLPVQIQDIERIEIVRGPNAALYGSGAGLGVINIITKAPKQRLAASAEGMGGSQGTAVSDESLNDSHGNFSYRLSHTYRDQGGYPTVDGSPTNDFLHSQKGSARAVWRPSERTSLDLYAGGSWDTLGEATGFGLPPPPSQPQARFFSNLVTARLSHALSGDDVVEVNLARNEQTTGISPLFGGGIENVRFYEYTFEALQSFGLDGDRYHTTWGGSFRYDVADSDYLFGDTPIQVNRTIRGYVHETARLTDKLSLVGGVSLEQPYFIGTRHADYQSALLYDLRPGQVLRASYSLAHTNPGFVDTKPNYFPVAGLIQLVPNPYIKSYELANYEVGYSGDWWDGKSTLGASLYYMKIRDHVNLETISPVGAPVTVLQFDNSNYLIARGAELEDSVKLGPGRSAYANMSIETVSDRDGHTLYIKTTPKYIANLGFIEKLGHFTASANTGWKDGYLGDSISGTNQVDIPPFWRLDARLAYSPLPNLELFVSGMNLLTPRHVEFVDGLTVPRRYYGGAQVKF